MTETAIYAAGGVVWRVVDEQAHGAAASIARRTAMSRSPRARSIPARCSPRRRCARSSKRPASGCASESRSASRATACPASGRRWSTTGRPRRPKARSRLRLRPEPRDRALEWVRPKKATARLELSGGRRDPRELHAARRRRRAADLPDSSPCAMPRRSRARSGTEGMPQAALAARPQAGRTPIVGPCSPSGRGRSSRAPRRDASRPSRRCRRRSGARSRSTGSISQDAWEEGTSDARTVVGERVRARKATVLCSHGPVLPEILTSSHSPRERCAARIWAAPSALETRRLLGRPSSSTTRARGSSRSKRTNHGSRQSPGSRCAAARPPSACPAQFTFRSPSFPTLLASLSPSSRGPSRVASLTPRRISRVSSRIARIGAIGAVAALRTHRLHRERRRHRQAVGAAADDGTSLAGDLVGSFGAQEVAVSGWKAGHPGPANP